MLRRVCCLSQLWLVGWFCLVLAGYTALAQDDSGTPSGDVEAQEPADPAPVADQEAPESDAAEPAAEDKPAEDKPAEDKPAEDKPAEDKPAEDKPAEDKPAEDKPAEDKPAEDKPAEDKPAEDKPAEDKPAEDKPAEDKPAEDKPAEDKPAEDKPAESAEPTPSAVFAAKLVEFKKVLLDLNQLRVDFATAEPDQATQIQGKWNVLITQGDAMISELTEAAKLAYVAAPNEDPEVTGFLMKRVADAIARDDYPVAADLSLAMLENGCDEGPVLEAAGLAAFVLNNFDNAKKYLTAAMDKGALGETGRNYLGDVESQRKLWEQEEQIRRAEVEADDLPRVRLTTSAGVIDVELFENEAPGAVGNFISLVESGFYDGLVFHRVLPAFMAQGGCPDGLGTGGPGYEIFCECEQENHRNHFAGTLSMAHAGKDTGGSQFFLTFVPTPFLNGRHTAFGRVISGMDVLPKIQRIDPESEGAKPEPDKIIKAEVIRKRDHEYKPDKTQ